MIIEEFRTELEWNYLWGKTVEDVNLNVHCARSLIGKYCKELDNETKELHNLEIPAKIFYVCGVAKPYWWANNFHLPLMEHKGAITEVERNGIYIRVKDAVELPIYFDLTLCTHKMREKKEYATCRNWQFAYLYKNLIRNKGENNG